MFSVSCCFYDFGYPVTESLERKTNMHARGRVCVHVWSLYLQMFTQVERQVCAKVKPRSQQRGMHRYECSQYAVCHCRLQRTCAYQYWYFTYATITLYTYIYIYVYIVSLYVYINSHKHIYIPINQKAA